MKLGIWVLFSVLVGTCAYAANTDAGGSQEDSLTMQQTRRVTQDKLTWEVLKSFEKKYKVHCSVPTSDDADNENPKWTCLNNNACSYKVAALCSQISGAHQQVMEVDITGFDDGTNTKVEDIQITYLENQPN